MDASRPGGFVNWIAELHQVRQDDGMSARMKRKGSSIICFFLFVPTQH